MLPFLQPKKMSSIIMAKARPGGPVEPIAEEGSEAPELMAAVEDFIGAVHAKDVAGAAAALRSAFDCCESMPHAGGEGE